ncbi:MAG TPA: hypothetical protein VF945_13645, partial [Polyangia bacterium]
MSKKPPARGRQHQPKPKSKLATKPRAKPSAKAPAKAKATARAPGSAAATEELLREAMEELGEARGELSRLGHAMTAAHRQIEDNRLSSASAREHLRSELNAVRTDLKTALAEAEIARIDRERTAAQAQRRIHELEDA